jgi:hypothetical protein
MSTRRRAKIRKKIKKLERELQKIEKTEKQEKEIDLSYERYLQEGNLVLIELEQKYQEEKEQEEPEFTFADRHDITDCF